MSKFTPGPWFVCNGTDVFTGLGAVNSQGCAASINDGWQIADCSIGVTFTSDGQESHLSMSENMANAALIAAAPDLLEELKLARSELEDLYLELNGEEYNNPALNAVIAKAEGVAE